MENMVSLKIGTVLIAIDECIMDFENLPALIIGNEYMVIGIDKDSFTISSHQCKLHEFKTIELNQFFKIKETIQIKTPIEKYIEFLEELKKESFEESKKMILNNDNSEVANSLYMAYSIALTKAKQLLY
jgi:hypothetical protein